MGPAQSAIKGGDVAVYDSFAVKSPCGGIDAPITARIGSCCSVGEHTFFRWPEGVQGASGKPPASINVRQLGRKQSPAGRV